MAFAAVEHGAVVGAQYIIEQRGVRAPDERAAATLDGAELEPAGSDLGPQRAGADPRQPDRRADDQQETEPQADGPAPAGGTMGGFGDGHRLVSGG